MKMDGLELHFFALANRGKVGEVVDERGRVQFSPQKEYHAEHMDG